MRAFLVVLVLVISGCANAGDEPSLNDAAAPSDVPVPPPTPPTPPGPARPSPDPDPALGSSARVRTIVALEVAAVDGVTLRGHAYLPDRAPPYATILGIGPYWGGMFPATDAMVTPEGGLARIYDDTTYDALLRAGFAVALFNIRGTGASEGCYHFFDPQDGPDAAAVVDAIAAQPWSDGDVGMYGVSYDGWTQYAAMAAGAVHLRATAPVSGILDVWSVHTRNGAPTRAYAGAAAYYSVGVAGAARSCADGARAALDVDLGGVTGDRTNATHARDLRAGVMASGIPAFVTYGLARPRPIDATRGEEPAEGLIMNAADLRGLPAGSRVLVGPWGHGPPPLADFPATIVRWFDHHLREGPPVEGAPVRYQEDDLAWRNATTWPPKEPLRRIAFDGARTLVSSERPPSLDACGPDHAVWVSAPLEGALPMAGVFRLAVSLTSTTPDANIAAYLFATDAEDPCDGQAVEIARAHTDLRHRGELARGEPFPVGVPVSFAFASAPFASTVPAGARLALVLGAGDWLELVPKPWRSVVTARIDALDVPLVEGG